MLLPGQEGRAGSKRGSLAPSPENVADALNAGIWGGHKVRGLPCKSQSVQLDSDIFLVSSHQLCPATAATPSSTSSVEESTARSPANKAD